MQEIESDSGNTKKEEKRRLHKARIFKEIVDGGNKTVGRSENAPPIWEPKKL